MALPQEIKQQLKERVLVTDVIKQYLEERNAEIRMQGKEFRAACPFEEGSTNASKFRVSRERFYCYACSETGDIFDWFIKTASMSYPEAEQKVAQLAGIDISQYLRTHKETEPEKKQRLISEALGVVGKLAYDTAMEMDEESRKIAGMDITDLVAKGEIGLLPDFTAIEAALKEAGVSDETVKASGILASKREFSKRWVFWARKKDKLAAGRLYGRPGPVVGISGSNSPGWTAGPAGATPAARNREPLLVLDDGLYLALRSRGVAPLARPVSTKSMNGIRDIYRSNEQGHSPVIVIPPEAEAREDAYNSALAAMGDYPRIRVVEWSSDGEDLTGEELRSSLIERAGTAVDWRVERILVNNGVSTPERAARSRESLEKLISAAKGREPETTVYTAVANDVAPAAKTTTR